ncbi:hypothetical protein L1049_018103 [Liquidambar formosana]|uniref:Tonoplast intrinsic protein n=1 Tax=Liquidambar formosana TaxID=63359 RepID=A0AAP0NK76_LIQFO
MAKIALGTGREATQPDCLKALIVEFICTFLFVFAGVGAAMATEKLAANALVGLFAVAMAHALVVAVMVAAGFHISGGHINPAVTLGLAVGGHITIFRSILYWIDQLLASALACILLKYLTGGMGTPIHTLASGVGYIQGVLMEVVLTFSLLFTVYATIVDPKKGSFDGLGPILTGFVVGANILAGGAFSGASMNPGAVLWACFGDRSLDRSLGLLGWAPHWWWASRVNL